MDIPGFDQLHELSRHGPYVLYRGRRASDQLPVLLERSGRSPAPEADDEGIERLFKLFRGLASPTVPRMYEVIRLRTGACLVLEDRGLIPLRLALERESPDVTSALRVACELCTALGGLHRRMITHGAINPSNILVGAELADVQLLNVGLALGNPFESADALRSMAYISPEQTGRMNRTVDYRSDFYSLGMTLYELLVGHPPFQLEDSLEL